MIHRVLRYPAKWEWHVLQQERLQAVLAKDLPRRKDNRSKEASPSSVGIEHASLIEQLEAEEQLHAIKRLLPECADWLDDCKTRRSNEISVSESAELGPLLFGTLMFQVSELPNDIHPFHFWLSGNRLVTMHEDLRLTIRLQSDSSAARLENCKSAPEALFVMLNVILDPFHSGLDGFENRLGELESSMRLSNRTGLMDVIFERRYDLLHWSHLFLPIRELHGAAKEAFMDDLIETDSFKRMTHKLERIESLLKHYALEIDTLISMDDAISSFRGNDIMKTLTIFTVLFTPPAVIGAIWGMNFDSLPWVESYWGFPLTCSIIILVTAGIYVWLWRKGWTGDLLTGRKSKKAATQSPIGRSSKKRSSSKGAERPSNPPEKQLSRKRRA